MKALWISLLAFALTSTSFAGDRYVDALNGSDSNSGQSWGDAWRTITHAAANVLSGDTVYVAPGLYDRDHGEVFPIEAGRLVGVEGPERTIVDGDGTGTIFTNAGSYLEGLTIRNAGRGVELEVWCSVYCEVGVVLRNVVLSDLGTGVRGYIWCDWEDAYMTLDLSHCVVQRCGTGVDLEVDSDPTHPDPPTAYGDIICTDSLFRDNTTGIYIFDWSEYVPAYASAHLKRCTFVGHTQSPVTAAEGDAGLWSCIVYGNAVDSSGAVGFAYSDTEHSIKPGTGNISADPLFEDPAGGKLRLRFGSPCADTGDPADSSGTDLLGTERPIDGDLDAVERIDMGAYELATLFPRDPARIGSTVDLEFWGPAGGTSTLAFRWGLPVGPTMTPYGEWDLGPAFVSTSFPTTATAPGPPNRHPLRIPADPSYVGRTLSLQAFTRWAPGLGSAAFTNPVVLTIVP